MKPICSSNCVVIDDHLCTWSELADGGAQRMAGLPEEPVAWISDSTRETMEVVSHAASRGLDLALITRERFSEGVREAILDSGLALPGEGIPAVPGQTPFQSSRIWLLTSGTTGMPKLIKHTWQSLLTVEGTPPPMRWLVPYQPGTYAWFQLVTLGLFNPGQDLVIADMEDLEGLVETSIRHRVDAISSTPTFWRMLFMSVNSDRLAQWKLRQISLGGEIVDQAILDQIKEVFPAAKVTHIFATTEVGACIVVKDGLAGFPSAFLSHPLQQGRTSLKVEDGRLWVRSEKASPDLTAGGKGWIDTGDRVEVVGERVRFLGRVQGSVINVGGNKAYPADVEAVILSHPAVQWCRVSARKAIMVGQVVKAEIVVGKGTEPGDTIEFDILRHCRSRLPEYAVPRLIEFLGEIPTTCNLKSTL